MTAAEAQMLTAKLMAAFPTPAPDPLTVEVYRERIEKLALFEAAATVVDELIDESEYLPRVSAIVDGYRRVKDRYAPQALREAPMSEEQRQHNLKMARELLDRLAASNQMEAS